MIVLCRYCRSSYLIELLILWLSRFVLVDLGWYVNVIEIFYSFIWSRWYKIYLCLRFHRNLGGRVQRNMHFLWFYRDLGSGWWNVLVLMILEIHLDLPFTIFRGELSLVRWLYWLLELLDLMNLDGLINRRHIFLVK
jgi:hypothetical protein